MMVTSCCAGFVLTYFVRTESFAFPKHLIFGLDKQISYSLIN